MFNLANYDPFGIGEIVWIQLNCLDSAKAKIEEDMIGFKVLTRQGLKGPFHKSSILKAITTAELPLQARLLDLETGRYLSAADLVGEEAGGESAADAPAPEILREQTDSISRLELASDSDELVLDDNVPE